MRKIQPAMVSKAASVVRMSVRRRPGFRSQGLLRIADRVLPCALGRGGLRSSKREGDGGTPIGRWPLLRVRYRPDVQMGLRTGLPLKPIRPADGWCDAPSDANYNRAVRHPYRASAELLWRSDRLYDVVIVLDYNVRRRARGRGSAIFMHVARAGYRPTEGCIALERRHLTWLLSKIARRATLDVLA
jgi:L,D-peptidoglycan transpeptidase YkuD (ErfK/YbiS/YcfS/YnhG family)